MTELVKSWRILTTSALYETRHPSRLAGVLAQLAMQIFLTWCLWNALYRTLPVSAGLDRGQAVTYAMLAVLYTRLRGPNRDAARDSVAIHVREGSILYWYLRPVDPQRYHLLRAVGDQAYGLAWAVAVFAICLFFGLIEPPASSAACVLFLVALTLGLVILYYLLALVDVACFWTLNSFGVLALITLAQSLFAGAIAPLWFFPGWFQTLCAWLPFQSSLHVPLSLYVGRIDPSSAGRYIVIQALWIPLLAFLLRLFWRRASRQVVVQGG